MAAGSLKKKKALFRLILVAPIYIFTASFAPSVAGVESGDLSVLFAGFFALPVALAIVFRQIYPSYLLAFNEALLSLQTRVDAYILLLTDEYPSIEDNDVVDAQIETNCDLIINKILFYLSQLPIQLTFSMMKPKLYQLCEYTRFNDYLKAWPT